MILMEPVNAPARWWPCACLTCVSGLRRLGRIFIFLRCIHVFDLVLKYGSDIHEVNWLQLLLFFLVFMGMVTAVIGFWFFFMFSIEVFSYCTLTETFAIGFQKLFNHEWIDFGFFFVGKWFRSLTSYLYGLKSARDAQLLFYFDDIIFFRCLG